MNIFGLHEKDHGYWLSPYPVHFCSKNSLCLSLPFPHSVTTAVCMENVLFMQTSAEK